MPSESKYPTKPGSNTESTADLTLKAITALTKAIVANSKLIDKQSQDNVSLLSKELINTITKDSTANIDALQSVVDAVNSTTEAVTDNSIQQKTIMTKLVANGSKSLTELKAINTVFNSKLALTNKTLSVLSAKLADKKSKPVADISKPLSAISLSSKATVNATAKLTTKLSSIDKSLKKLLATNIASNKMIAKNIGKLSVQKVTKAKEDTSKVSTISVLENLHVTNLSIDKRLGSIDNTLSDMLRLDILAASNNSEFVDTTNVHNKAVEELLTTINNQITDVLNKSLLVDAATKKSAKDTTTNKHLLTIQSSLIDVQNRISDVWVAIVGNNKVATTRDNKSIKLLTGINANTAKLIDSNLTGNVLPKQTSEIIGEDQQPIQAPNKREQNPVLDAISNNTAVANKHLLTIIDILNKTSDIVSKGGMGRRGSGNDGNNFDIDLDLPDRRRRGRPRPKGFKGWMNRAKAVGRLGRLKAKAAWNTTKNVAGRIYDKTGSALKKGGEFAKNASRPVVDAAKNGASKLANSRVGQTVARGGASLLRGGMSLAARAAPMVASGAAAAAAPLATAALVAGVGTAAYMGTSYLMENTDTGKAITRGLESAMGPSQDVGDDEARMAKDQGLVSDGIGWGSWDIEKPDKLKENFSSGELYRMAQSSKFGDDEKKQITKLADEKKAVEEEREKKRAEITKKLEAEKKGTGPQKPVDAPAPATPEKTNKINNDSTSNAITGKKFKKVYDDPNVAVLDKDGFLSYPEPGSSHYVDSTTNERATPEQVSLIKKQELESLNNKFNTTTGDTDNDTTKLIYTADKQSKGVSVNLNQPKKDLTKPISNTDTNKQDNSSTSGGNTNNKTAVNNNIINNNGSTNTTTVVQYISKDTSRFGLNSPVF